MSNIFRNVISASLSPNTTSKDVRSAWRVMFSPWTWKYGTSHERVVQWFRDHYRVGSVSFFQSGRVALYEILTSLDIGAGDEVLVQAFTCVAVPNSVKWAGSTPVYVDIDDSLNIDPTEMVKRITPRTRAIIVQHTFGIPADMKTIMALAAKHKLLVIEDCAHAIGAMYDGKQLGTFGDAAFFSFGRDKAISSVWGGAAFINRLSQVKAAAERLKHAEQKLPQPGYFWIFQQVLHPIVFACILPMYRSGIGKAILVLLQQMRLLSKPVAPLELTGGQPKGSMTQYPNGLAQLLEVQLTELPAMIRTRQENAQYFRDKLSSGFTHIVREKGASYLRYPVLVDDPIRLRQSARRQGILLGNWYHHVIDPVHTDFTAIGYVRGSCPRAESAAACILNLPTLISKRDAAAVIEVII